MNYIHRRAYLVPILAAVGMYTLSSCATSSTFDQARTSVTMPPISAISTVGSSLSPVSLSTEQPAAYVSAATSKGSALPASTALAEVVPQVNQSLVQTVRIGANPPGARVGPWLYFDISCDTVTDGGCLKSLWEADLVQGDVAELMRSSQSNLANVITGSTTIASLADGSTVNLGGDQGDVAAGQQFTAGQSSDAAIDAAVSSVCADNNVSVVSEQVLHPLDDALSLRLQFSTDALDSGVTIKKIESDIQQKVGTFEGIYVEALLADGSTIARASNALRSGFGRQWSDPAYPYVTGYPHL